MLNRVSIDDRVAPTIDSTDKPMFAKPAWDDCLAHPGVEASSILDAALQFPFKLKVCGQLGSGR
jgi:hypothetical protein